MNLVFLESLGPIQHKNNPFTSDLDNKLNLSLPTTQHIHRFYAHFSGVVGGGGEGLNFQKSHGYMGSWVHVVMGKWGHGIIF